MLAHFAVDGSPPRSGDVNDQLPVPGEPEEVYLEALQFAGMPFLA